MSTQFTEQDTEGYYDKEDSSYRTFWDRDGSLHWGYFDETTGDDFLAASAHWNDVLLTRSGIDADSIVLDLGCGNGNTSMWLARETGCRVKGADLSGVRIRSAREAASCLPSGVQERLQFMKASATELPFDEGAFTHVWSQATIYHVPDKPKALSEAFRVLSEGGIFIFDDLTKPKPQVSAQAQKHVYDRLLFDTPFSFEGYKRELEAHGFVRVQAEDLSEHLATSYRKLGEMAAAATADGRGDFSAFVTAYRHMVTAIEDGELGWATYLCRK